ncbi:hypothetical protein [Martelella sp. HB161492]|uniref:hypothetical protein n=1 Tax=Martelella sp. HB161492 TaxID=2720726 RepID=UPI0015924AE3|nr:hypothetical protein [Martelella sp. HB161492]
MTFNIWSGAFPICPAGNRLRELPARRSSTFLAGNVAGFETDIRDYSGKNRENGKLPEKYRHDV